MSYSSRRARRRYNRYPTSSYVSQVEQDRIREEEKKLVSKLNELAYIDCPGCSKKLVRIFAPKVGRQPIFKDDLQKYLSQMRKSMKAYDRRGGDKINYIAGPEYTLVFNSVHYKNPYSDNLGSNTTVSYCNYGCIIGMSGLEIASRFMLGHKSVRNICIANHVEPQEIRDWLATVDPSTFSDLFGNAIRINKIEDTDLWSGIYYFNDLQPEAIQYDIEKVAGSAWAAECDPVVGDVPITNSPIHGQQRYDMMPTHGRVCYSGRNYKSELALDLPAGLEWSSLADHNWNKFINVETITGFKAKIGVAVDKAGAKHTNTLTRAFFRNNVPEKFWIIQSEHYVGSDPIAAGDLIL